MPLLGLLQQLLVQRGSLPARQSMLAALHRATARHRSLRSLPGAQSAGFAKAAASPARQGRSAPEKPDGRDSNTDRIVEVWPALRTETCRPAGCSGAEACGACRSC